MSLISRSMALLLLACAGAAHGFFITPTFVYEWANGITGHYVLLDASEASQVAAGSAGPGWEPTGYQFEVVAATTYPTQKGVCRFYSPVNNSHFFTADAAECDYLRTTPSGWNYEKIAFTVIAVPTNGSCGSLQPVYRLFNGRVAQHDVNHRFTPDAQVRDQMIAAGWNDEGIAFCTGIWRQSPLKSFSAGNGPIKPAAECESRVGPCVALKHLPAMPNLVYLFFPPFYVNKNPDYPAASVALTGVTTDLFTAQPPTDATAITSHSFVHMFSGGGPPWGIHIASGDRLSSPYAAISPMYQLAGMAPPAGGIDERVFPWNGPRHHTLMFDFSLVVPTVKRADASSHAYGGLLVRFGDASTGRSFLVTVQAYGTQPSGDFSARDADTSEPIVSTVFRPNPAFGAAPLGEYAQCTGDAGCLVNPVFYRFSIADADFVKILDSARALDPALSGNPADYFVGQFRVQNETYGSAELGADVQTLSMKLWY